ncbi:DM13 domain-containing protein [candidate division KSB1 bacterium]|nr:DM13 domain-containing protein [candidate division KSB1 bacterium]
MNSIKYFLMTTLFLVGCVGTDLVNEPVATIPARIVINPNSSAVEAGKTTSFQAVYYDSLGNAVAGVTFQWLSSDPNIATVDANGLVAGKQVGQVQISAKARGVTSTPAMLTVVADAIQVARVAVTPDNGQTTVGGTLQFSAVARNLNGDVIGGKTFTWRSLDATIATVNSNGLATGLKAGKVNIIAAVEGVESPPARLTVLGTNRSGTFTKRPGTSYNVSGTATLEQQPNGSLVLKFGSDFSSSSGPGLEVFLSTTNTVGANSRNLGRLQRTSGAQSYNVPAGIGLNTYNWVIIHCVPFNVTFGYAQLQ